MGIGVTGWFPRLKLRRFIPGFIPVVLACLAVAILCPQWLCRSVEEAAASGGGIVNELPPLTAGTMEISCPSTVGVASPPV